MVLRVFRDRIFVPAMLAMAAVAAPAMAAIDAPSKPSLWVVRDADTTIYLFGTFHALDRRTAWVDPRIASALAVSDRLVLETVIPADRDELKRRGTKALRDQPKAFIAATSAAVKEGRRQGLSVDDGADAVLRRRAEAMGKPVDGLETIEEQLATLASIPAVPAGAAGAAVRDDGPPVSMADLLGAWHRGDQRAFARMLASFEAKAPVAYRLLMADRNARWEERIERMMDQPGTVFVAVGAGHLAGRHSLIALLEARGRRAIRVD